jgi:hypothetical protein
MAKRKAISKTTRFEVLKRDRFTCRYCGAQAPAVVLVMEHVVPVAEGGTNDIMNLVAACEPCNQGKGARLLDDRSRTQAERTEMDRAAAEREQLRQLAEWRNELRDSRMDTLSEYFRTNTGQVFTDSGRAAFRRFLASGLRPAPTDAEVLDAIDTVAAKHPFPTDVVAFMAVIIRTERKYLVRPELRAFHYIRGILRKRVRVDERFVMGMLDDAFQRGMGIEEIKRHAIDCRSWTDFRHRVGGDA